MKFAVRNDKQGWRAVSGLDDLGPEEWFTEDTPPDPIVAAQTGQALVFLAMGKRDQLLAVAANRMGPLQDSIDEEVATADEVADLKRWKQYRIALNRIDKQDNFPIDIDWPQPPDDIQAS